MARTLETSFEVLCHLEDGSFTGPFALRTSGEGRFAIDVGEGIAMPLPARVFTPIPRPNRGGPGARDAERAA
ncbi:MAG: hypothetical protein D6776_06975 [Planctomycetota bacterium]|nr:MAG: hypothetical protein D6776_06975 [Planctomycetota bacterium]